MKGIRHTGIYVRNLEAMVSFYKELFQLQVVVHQKENGPYTERLFNETDMEIEVCKLEFEDHSIIELIHCQNAADDLLWNEKIYRCGRIHVAVTVESAGEMYRKLKEKQCIILSEPCDSPDGKARVFFARDIEGNYLELVEEMGREEK